MFYKELKGSLNYENTFQSEYYTENTVLNSSRFHGIIFEKVNRSLKFIKLLSSINPEIE
jgi:hypothetical protein